MNKPDRLDNNPPEPILLPGADDLASAINEAMIEDRLLGRAKEFAAADLEAIQCNSMDDAMRRTTLVKQATIFYNSSEEVRKRVKAPYDAAVKAIQGGFKDIQAPALAVKDKAMAVLREYMEAHNLPELKTDSGQTAYWKETKSLDVDMNLLPDEYVIWTPDEKKIKEALKAGLLVPGAKEKTTKTLVVS